MRSKHHVMESVKAIVKDHTNSELSFLPGYLTKRLQAAYGFWNEPFKEVYQVLYDKWMANGENLYASAGNMHPPSKITVVQ